MLAFVLFSCWRAEAADVAPPPAEPGTGTIAGTVEGVGKDAWVWVEDPVGGPAGPRTKAKEAATMGQTGRKFEHDVLTVVQGTTVDFPNYGSEVHEVNWVTREYSDQLEPYEPGVTQKRDFKVPGTYPLGCQIHDEMSAHILVVPNDWFARVDKAGRYTIPNVPAGTYEVRVWSPTSPTTVTSTVQVVEGQVAGFNPRLDTR